MSLASIIKRFAELGCNARDNGGEIEIDIDDIEVRLPVDADWNNAIQAFYRARQYTFDSDRRVLVSNRAVEYLVVRLDPGFYYRVSHKFSDASESPRRAE